MQKLWEYFKKAQILNFLLTLVLLWGLFNALIRFDDIVKIIGFPFSVIPHALGITQPITREETQQFTIYVNDSLPVQFEEAGDYYVYTSFFYDFWLGPYIKIEGENGLWFELEKAVGKPRLYDTIFVRGTPTYKVKIEEPGEYIFHFLPRYGGLSGVSEITPEERAYQIGFVPDHITGNEETYKNSYRLQFILLIILLSALYYFKYYLPNKKKKERSQNTQKDKRDAFEEFMRKNSSK